jgi:DNA repair exonuclease SbcCD ATPase subunit
MPDTERLRELLDRRERIKADLDSFDGDRRGHYGALEAATAELVAETLIQLPTLLDALAAAEARADKAEAERDELRSAIDDAQGDVGPNLWRFWQQKCKGYITRAADAEDRAEAAEAQVVRLTEALRYMREVYSKPDERMCCDGRECGCYGATVQQYADYIADEALTEIEARAALEGDQP